MFFLKFPMMGSSRFLADFGALMQRRLKNDNNISGNTNDAKVLENSEKNEA